MAEKKIGIRITAKGDQARRELGRLRDQFIKTRSAAQAAGLSFEKLDKTSKAIRFRAAVGNMRDFIGMATRAVQVVDQLVMRSIKMAGVNQTLSFSLEKAKKASMGMVDSLTLTTLAVEAQRAGVAKNGKEFARLADIAVQTGLKVGRGPVESIERLTRGLAKNEQEILDELGVTTRAGDAYRIYAARIGKTADELTGLEKAHASSVIRLEELEAKMGDTRVELGESQTAWLELKKDWEEAITVVSKIPELLDKVRESSKGAAFAIETLGSAMAAGVGIGTKLIGVMADLNNTLTPQVLDKGTLFGGLKKNILADVIAQDIGAVKEANTNLNNVVGGFISEHEARIRKAEELNKRALKLIEDSTRKRGGRGRGKKDKTDLSIDHSGSFIKDDPISDKRSELALKFEEAELNAKINADTVTNTAVLDSIEQTTHERRVERLTLESQLRDEARTQRNENFREWKLMTANLEKMELTKQEKAIIRAKRAQVAFDSINQLTAGSMDVLNMALQGSEMSAARQAKIMNRALGAQAMGIGALEVVKAAAAAASFNVPKAVLHSAAAALAFTKGGLLLSGHMDPSSAASTSSGGGGGGGFSGRGSAERPEGPVSRPDIPAGSDAPPGPTGNQASGGTNINQVNISTLATNDEDLFIRLDQGLKDVKRTTGDT